ncbi:MAG: NAD(P)-dependent oxidoreductase [Burkholderiaceae bacterium]|nr:NAD(P)-dependent oxidoreductase [Burkholderiaceae bacterium]
MNPPPSTIGILGLGLVGQALAARLKTCGHQIAGCDPSESARTCAKVLGVQLLPDAAALAQQCESVVICVLDDAMLLACAQALADAPGQLKLAISCVTASVQATAGAATLLRRRGIAFADMPLLGSSRQIAQGEALGLLGADDAERERWGSLLMDICPRHRHVGAQGMGVRAKLACNLVLGLNRAALAEGLALATTLGLDGTQFLDLLRESPAYSRAVDIAGPRMVARDFSPASRIRQHRKDLALILSQGEQSGLDLSLTAAHAELLDRAIAQGLGDLDNVAVIAAILPPAAPAPPPQGTPA